MADASSENAQTIIGPSLNDRMTGEQPDHHLKDPLFISKSERVPMCLVDEPFQAIINFVSWKRRMEMTLGMKMKLGFLRGISPKPSEPNELARWERCDVAIHTWLINSDCMDIH